MDRDVILRLLPEVMRETAGGTAVLDAVVDAMAEQHARPEDVLSDLDLWFRPLTTPDAALPALAGWVDLDWLLTGEQQAGREPFGPGVERLRALIDDVRVLSSWRGTAYGLTRFLETATGVEGFEVSSPDARPFHVEVRVPTAAAPHLALVERIVAEEAPVCTTHDVVLAGAAAPAAGIPDVPPEPPPAGPAPPAVPADPPPAVPTDDGADDE